ncbi:transcriptional regulator [Arthrobacter sp. MYb227]|uniref:AraC family transcriptional regulator n=1 Tax=Arthrobacter sp. MYb227 TaxID=1848601 RepID=UPI000CFB607A|nr:helix-turn-helix domain-containing protein [Arthrobacter sp. MYb227]PQZ94717.1 transcriptional regulator [Arthrobacter sp. MYb227]
MDFGIDAGRTLVLKGAILGQEETAELQRRLFASIDPRSHFNRLFDHLSGIHFFAKDRDGHILFANKGLARVYGFETEEDFVGRTDFDVLPKRLAEKFWKDDLHVMETGNSLLNIVEIFLSPEGIPDWYSTNKLPLWSSDGKIVGLMGTIQDHRDADDLEHPQLDVDVAVAHLRATFAQNTPVSELAQMCKLSARQFESKFQAAYNTSPHQFRIRLRVKRACELLRDSDMSVTEIALEAGFYDQSALAHHLKTIMGYTPLQYRKRYR